MEAYYSSPPTSSTDLRKLLQCELWSRHGRVDALISSGTSLPLTSLSSCSWCFLKSLNLGPRKWRRRTLYPSADTSHIELPLYAVSTEFAQLDLPLYRLLFASALPQSSGTGQTGSRTYCFDEAVDCAVVVYGVEVHGRPRVQEILDSRVGGQLRYQWCWCASSLVCHFQVVLLSVQDSLQRNL